MVTRPWTLKKGFEHVPKHKYKHVKYHHCVQDRQCYNQPHLEINPVDFS